MYDQFDRLLKEKGVNTAAVCKATGISQSTISNWKKRGTDLNSRNAKKIADYFGVSVDCLIYGDDPKEVSSNTGYEIFNQLLITRGLKKSDVARATGIHPSTFSDWKKGKSKPKFEKLKLIADYFNVSVQYLVTGRSDSSADYNFLNNEVVEIAKELFNNPDLLALFSTARSSSSDDLKLANDILLALNRK